MHQKLSIIIINYNTAILTFNCVLSIIKKTPATINFEIIIVDNGSRYEDFLILKEKTDALKTSFIKLIRSKLNSGFSSGNMQGVQHASGDLLAFVNNDVVFINDPFSYSINYLQEKMDIGAVGLQPVFENGDKQVAFGHFDTFNNRILGYWLYEQLFPKKTKRHGVFTHEVEVDYIVGSFMLFRSKDFYAINGFDTNIFLYFEEMDICKRLKMNNLKTVFIPSINYVHLNGMSTNLGYIKKIELKISHLYVVRKNHGFFSYLILKCFFIFIFLLKSIFNFKHFKMLTFLLTIGPSLSQSIRHRQIIQPK